MYNNKWVYSPNEEIFSEGDHYDTREEAIEAGIEFAKECDDGYVYVGQCKEHIPYIDIESMLEQVSETAYDDVGEVAEDYLDYIADDAKKDLEEKISQVFNEWLQKYKLEPSFYKVINLEKIEIEQE